MLSFFAGWLRFPISDGFVGITVRYIQVVALAARRSMQIQYQVHVVGLTPGQQAVGHLETFVDPGVLPGNGSFQPASVYKL